MLHTRNYVKSQLVDETFPLFSGPLLVIVHFCIPAPSKVRYNKRKLQHRTPHIKKPDGDNLEKFLNDSLNGILWQDDSRIAWLLRSKSITKEKKGETIVFVRELDKDIPNYDLILSDIMENIRLVDDDSEL